MQSTLAMRAFYFDRSYVDVRVAGFGRFDFCTTLTLSWPLQFRPLQLCIIFIACVIKARLCIHTSSDEVIAGS